MAWRAMRPRGGAGSGPAGRHGPGDGRRGPSSPSGARPRCPRPVSPWKYSWNSSRSRHSGSSRNFAIEPATGPVAVGVREPDRDEAPRQVGGDVAQPEPAARARRVLDGELVAERLVPAQHRLDEQVVDREPDRAAPVRVAAEQAASSTRRARSRSTRGSPRSRSGTAPRGAGARGPAARAARGTRPRDTPRAAPVQAAPVAGG